MKKLLPIILSIMMILPCNIALAADEFTPEEDFVSKAEATQFAEELKELDGAVKKQPKKKPGFTKK